MCYYKASYRNVNYIFEAIDAFKAYEEAVAYFGTSIGVTCEPLTE